MKYWLMKSEPSVFSIQDLRRLDVAPWDGVRNYQARNFLRAMRRGDQALFFYSSVSPSAVVGRMEIVREAYPDPTQFDPKNPHFDPGSRIESPRWDLVDVKFRDAFPRPLAAKTLRKVPGLERMVLFQNSRLSVQPVTDREWKILLSLATA